MAAVKSGQDIRYKDKLDRKWWIKAQCIKIDLEQLTNHSITTRNYVIDTAVSMYAIRKHGCHDLSNKSTECCT